MTTSEIAALIRAGIPDAEVVVRDGGSEHFEAHIVSPAFAGKSLVERHQLVYASLKGAMAGAIHALSIKASTPQEAAAGRKEG